MQSLQSNFTGNYVSKIDLCCRNINRWWLASSEVLRGVVINSSQVFGHLRSSEMMTKQHCAHTHCFIRHYRRDEMRPIDQSPQISITQRGCSNVNLCPLKSDTMTNCSQVETPMRTTSMQMSFPETVSDSLCRNSLVVQPIVAAVVLVAGLRRSWRWRCWMWRSWAGMVTRGLRLWGWLDVLPNSLKLLWRQLMVEKWTFNSRETALVDIPAVSMPIARSLKTSDICGIVPCDKTAHFRAAFYCGQPKRHLCNNHAV